MKNPTVFIVGAPKSGTTSMCNYLAQHPQVFFSKIKEPRYFGRDLEGFRHAYTLEEYLALFEDAGDRLAGEGSVWYLVSKTAAAEIHQFNPDAKIIIMLRNPADVMYAMHNQNYHREGIEDIEDFEQALDAEADRRLGHRIPKSCEDPFKIFYGEIPRYTEQVQRYLDIFGKDQVHIIVFDDFKDNTLESYGKTLRFLDIEPSFVPDLKIHNPSKRMRSRFIHKLLINPHLRAMARTVVSKRWHRPIGLRLIDMNVAYEPRAPIKPETRKTICERYRPEMEQLSQLLKLDLTHWYR